MATINQFHSVGASYFCPHSSDPLSVSLAPSWSRGELDGRIPPSTTLLGASSVPSTAISDPGSGLGQAFNIGTLKGTQTFSDFVGSTDPNDYYRLDLSAPSSLNIILNGLIADANLQLFNSSGTLIGSSANLGTLAESINHSNWTPGTYYVRVYQSSGDTNYNLNLTADSAGNTLSAARSIGSLNTAQTFSDFVGSSDPNDYYQLNLSVPGSLNVALNGMSADANLQLFNSNGALIGSSSQVGNLPESISISGLAAGTYYVRVYQSSGDTNYTLNLSSTPLQSETTQTLPGVTTGSTNPQTPSVSTGVSNVLSTLFSVVDASGDNTPYTAFQGGAVRLSYNFQDVASLSNVRVEAIRNGSVAATLGTWNGASLSNGLVNLASFSTLTAGDYQLRAVIHTTNGQDLISATQSISILPNNRFNGTFAADTFEYSTGIGKGSIFLGRGGTDTLDFVAAGISRAMVTSINGLSLSAFEPLSGLALSNLTANQAIYGGTAFDYITLSDGREIYFQGIEYLRFADGPAIELQVHPNDPYFNSQWNLTVSDVTSAWRFTQGASNILLVSLDTGLPVGANGLVNTVDIATNRLTSAYWPWANDDYNDYGHGHSAISIMAGTANNALDIAGINWNSPVYVNDVYGGNGAGWRLTLQGAIQNAISYARANNMKVVFQGGIQGDVWLNDGGTQAQLEQLIQANSDIAVFAIAAGNGGTTDNLNMTAGDVNGVAKLQTTLNNVISVGALQRTSTATVNGLTNAATVDIAPYSNRGSDLTLVAATDSLAVDKFGNVNTFLGTSAANPNVAGIASLLWSVNPALTGAQVRQILTETAMDLGTTGRDNTFGSGLVDADAAVRRAVALQRNAEVANLYSGSSLLV